MWRQAQASSQGQAVAAELHKLQDRLRPVWAGAVDQLPTSLHESMQQFMASSQHHVDGALAVLQPYWASSKVGNVLNAFPDISHNIWPSGLLVQMLFGGPPAAAPLVVVYVYDRHG